MAVPSSSATRSARSLPTVDLPVHPPTGDRTRPPQGPELLSSAAHHHGGHAPRAGGLHRDVRRRALQMTSTLVGPFKTSPNLCPPLSPENVRMAIRDRSPL